MTTRLSADSTRRIGAQKFGAALRAAMLKRQVGQVRLAKAAKVSTASISNYRLGRNVPTLPVAERLASLLGDDTLVLLATQARQLACDNCGKSFVVASGSPQRYCTEQCVRLAAMKRGPNPARGRAIVAERTLTLYRDTVAEMCRGCEPLGVCRDASCALRPVSPIPVSNSSTEVGTIEPRRRNGPDWLVSVRAANAKRWTDEARQEFSEAQRARAASRTDEERAAFGRAVSEGRRRRAAA